MISANIWCECFDCIYNVDPTQCTFKGLRNITVLHKDESIDYFRSSDETTTCNEFLDYRETEEYQSVFWKAIRRNNKAVRLKAKGKRIVINGMAFYSDEKADKNLTDERTGYVITDIYVDKKPEFFESEKYLNIPDVMTLEEEVEA